MLCLHVHSKRRSNVLSSWSTGPHTLKPKSNLSNCTQQISPLQLSACLLFLENLFPFFSFSRTSPLNRATHFYVCCSSIWRERDGVGWMCLEWIISGWRWCVRGSLEVSEGGFQQGNLIKSHIEHKYLTGGYAGGQGGRKFCKHSQGPVRTSSLNKDIACGIHCWICVDSKIGTNILGLSEVVCIYCRRFCWLSNLQGWMWSLRPYGTGIGELPDTYKVPRYRGKIEV